MATALSHPDHDPARITRAERSDQTRDLFALLDVEEVQSVRDDLVERIVHLNLRVSDAIAARYRGRGVDQDDLRQAASHGLLKATLHFDPSLGKDFLTYAVPTIRGEVQRYFRDVSWTVRPPRRIQELQWRVTQSIDRLSLELGHEPSESEVMVDLDIEYPEYAEAVTAFGCFQPPSVDQPAAGLGGLTVGEAVADDHDWHGALEARMVLGPAMGRLTDRDRRILYLRFVEERTQQQIGDELGVAQMQVSRWLTSILRRLRTDLDTEPGTDESTQETR